MPTYKLKRKQVNFNTRYLDFAWLIAYKNFLQTVLQTFMLCDMNFSGRRNFPAYKPYFVTVVFFDSLAF